MDEEAQKQLSLFPTQYGILKSIFQHLPFQDVSNAASQVCQSWSEISKLVLEKRKGIPHVMIYHPYSEQGLVQEAVEYVHDFNVSDETRSIIESVAPDIISISNSIIACRSLVPEYQNYIWRAFSRQFSEPQLILFIGNPTIYETFAGLYCNIAIYSMSILN